MLRHPFVCFLVGMEAVDPFRWEPLAAYFELILDGFLEAISCRESTCWTSYAHGFSGRIINVDAVDLIHWDYFG